MQFLMQVLKQPAEVRVTSRMISYASLPCVTVAKGESKYCQAGGQQFTYW